LKKRIDLRSDTVTEPTQEMRDAMHTAVVGDDVFGEDSTVAEFEALAADMLGKEAGLLVTSGTLGNLLAVLCHTKPGDEVMVEKKAHIYYFERGMTTVAGVTPFPLSSDRGVIRPEHIKAEMRGASGHESDVALLCLENTHNLWGGTAVTAQEMDAACDFAKQHGMKVHLDGARLFNAAVALGAPAKELARGSDSVMICLAKSLCAPVGSALVGSREFIKKARRWRSILGGGMRQAGIIAAAGSVALRTMVDRLAVDHENAKLLGRELNTIPGLKVDESIIHTNLVYAVVDPAQTTPRDFVTALRERDVYCFAASQTELRFATHKDVTKEQILEAVAIMKQVYCK